MGNKILTRDFNIAACTRLSLNPGPLIKLEEIPYHLIRVLFEYTSRKRFLSSHPIAQNIRVYSLLMHFK